MCAGRSSDLLRVYRLPARNGSGIGVINTSDGAYSSGNCSGVTPDSLFIRVVRKDSGNLYVCKCRKLLQQLVNFAKETYFYMVLYGSFYMFASEFQ